MKTGTKVSVTLQGLVLAVLGILATQMKFQNFIGVFYYLGIGVGIIGTIIKANEMQGIQRTMTSNPIVALGLALGFFGANTLAPFKITRIPFAFHIFIFFLIAFYSLMDLIFLKLKRREIITLYFSLLTIDLLIILAIINH